MNRTVLAILVGTVAMTGYVTAGETRTVTHDIKDKKTVICTTDGKGPVTCETKTGEVAGSPAPGNGDRRVVVITDNNEGHPDGEDVNVQVIEDGNGKEKRVIIVRRTMNDGADANKDGMITRREFIAGAEKRFAEMDKNKDGVLSKEEATPPLPPLPPIEGMMAPLPPHPTAPPSPPAPPAPPSR